MDFSTALRPISVSQAIAAFTQRQALVSRGAPERLGAFVDWEALAGLTRVKEGRFVGEVKITRAGYNFLSRIDPYGGENLRGVDRFRYLTTDGCSIKIEDVQRYLQLYEGMALNIMNLFGETININAYYSPENSCGALPPHADSHGDYLILQIYGTKRWFINQRDSSEHRVITLSSGDILLNPVDTLHHCETSGEASLHLAIRIARKKYSDFLDWMREEIMAQEPKFSRFLPYEAEDKRKVWVAVELFREKLPFSESVFREFLLGNFQQEYFMSSLAEEVSCGEGMRGCSDSKLIEVGAWTETENELLSPN